MRYMRGECKEVIHKACGVVYKALCRATVFVCSHAKIREPDGHGFFYAYYQIGGEDESDEAETEPKKEGELKSRYRGSHSPFGFIWQIADATGWSVDYILNKVNYQTLIMMLSDAPRYVGDKKRSSTKKGTGDLTPEAEAAEIANIFRSNLKQ